MGTFSVEVGVRKPGSGNEAWAPVKCLVDTGAGFCQFPTTLLTSLGINPEREIPVVLADGRPANQPAAWLEIRYLDRTAYTLVLFAGQDALTLLGAHALEGLGLVVDPARRPLEPGRFPLA
jgi:aspartyl protease family protein